MAVISILVTAAALRFAGAQNDLWLDEIWSLELVGRITSPLHVFTAIHHDNNHYLNSLWLYLAGMRGNWWGYRAISILAGIGSVAVAGLIARRRGFPAAVFAMLLITFSYVQVLYASEARGYASVVFFSFLSYWALESYFLKPRLRFALLFAASATLGFVAHLTFLIFYCAALLWSGWHLAETRAGWRHVATTILACHSFPAVFFVALYWIDVRHQTIGGGVGDSLLHCYMESLAWMGGFSSTSISWGAASLAMGLMAAGFWVIRHDECNGLPFFIGVIVIVPLAIAWVRNADVIYVRHFIIGMAFFLILFAYLLAFLFQTGWWGKVGGILLLAGFFALNGSHILGLLKHGRGQSQRALRFIAEHSRESAIRIGGSQDFRIVTLLQFHGPQAMKGTSPTYYLQNDWPTSGLDWFIAQKPASLAPVPLGVWFQDNTGHRYRLVRVYPSAPLSGLHWFVYRRSND